MIKEKSKTWHATSAKIGQLFSTCLPFPPGFYTLTSFLLALIAVFFAYFHCGRITIGLFLTAGMFDLIDGAVARTQDKASHFGAFIDGTTDRFVDFAIIFSYFFFDIHAFWLDINQLICVASFIVIMPSFIVAYANHRKAVHDDNETLIWRILNRGEMFVLMIGVLVLSLMNADWAGYLLILMIVLGTITIAQTIFATIYHARKTLSL